MYESNNDIVQYIDFEILNPKYIGVLGKEKINLIGCYPDIQDSLLKLDEKEIKFWAKTIDDYSKNMQSEDWTPFAAEILNNIKHYDILLENVGNLDELSQEDFAKITQVILQGSQNKYKITDINQVRDFENIRREYLEQKFEKMNITIEEKKSAVIEKIFGHDFKYARNMISKYGESIENIDNEELKDYIRSLKLIEETSDMSQLKRIFDVCEFADTDKSYLERSLKNEYGKMLNEGLYRPKEQDLIENKSNIYNAGVDFKILMTSVGAFSEEKRFNYKESWNRASIGTQHFCTSYIRNDMIGTAPIRNICYGFSEVKPDSFVAMGEENLDSGSNKFVSESYCEKYWTPDQLINKTIKFNEIDIKRTHEGVKQQPDYILVFRKNGEIPNMENAQKASEQWGNLPIVIIDIDACLESEREKVEEMKKEYKEKPTPELKKQITQKVRNNRVTSDEFYKGVKFYEFFDSIDKTTTSQEYLKEVTEEDMVENYDKVTATDRVQTMTKIQNVYKRAKEQVERFDFDFDFD